MGFRGFSLLWTDERLRSKGVEERPGKKWFVLGIISPDKAFNPKIYIPSLFQAPDLPPRPSEVLILRCLFSRLLQLLLRTPLASAAELLGFGWSLPVFFSLFFWVW